MLRRIALILLLLASLLAPHAAAQNETTPSPHETSDLPGPEESREGRAGNTFGIAVLVGTLAITGLLAYVTMRRPARRR